MVKKYGPIQRTRASDLIVEEIWASILNGELKPGDRLPPERELVKQFDVSKVTLREALQALEANGYIERKRGVNGGSIVLELAPNKGIGLLCEYLMAKNLDLEEIISIRLILDPLISETAARMITPDDSHQLKLLIEKHQKEYSKTGKSKFGWHFEQFLAKLSRNRIMMLFTDLIMQLVIDFESALVNEPILRQEEPRKLLDRYYRQTFEEHQAIAQAVINHDPEGAKQAMLEHRLNWAEIFRQLSQLVAEGKGLSDLRSASAARR